MYADNLVITRFSPSSSNDYKPCRRPFFIPYRVLISAVAGNGIHRYAFSD